MAVTSVVVSNPTRSVTITDRTRDVTVSTVALPSSSSSVTASSVSVTPYGTISSTTLDGALQELADQNFRSSSEPTGDNLEEGDIWYNTSTEQFYVYREVSTGVFDWVPILLGAAGGDSDTLDAGAF